MRVLVSHVQSRNSSHDRVPLVLSPPLCPLCVLVLAGIGARSDCSGSCKSPRQRFGRPLATWDGNRVPNQAPRDRLRLQQCTRTLRRAGLTHAASKIAALACTANLNVPITRPSALRLAHRSPRCTRTRRRFRAPPDTLHARAQSHRPNGQHSWLRRVRRRVRRVQRVQRRPYAALMHDYDPSSAAPRTSARRTAHGWTPHTGTLEHTQLGEVVEGGLPAGATVCVPFRISTGPQLLVPSQQSPPFSSPLSE
jgi:hypothetical protein